MQENTQGFVEQSNIQTGVYTRSDGLRYDPNLIMDMPRGVHPKPSDMNRPPKVEQKSGPALARTLLFAQLPLDPLRLSAHKPSPSTKLNSAQRRAAKIAAGKLKVSEDGALVGAQPAPSSYDPNRMARLEIAARGVGKFPG